MINEKKIWLWAGWVASYLQRSLSAQVNGGPDATPDLWKQPFSAVRGSAKDILQDIWPRCVKQQGFTDIICNITRRNADGFETM